MKAVCPICQKEIDWKGNRYRPFCSERCKRVDLGRWASGEYRIAAPSEDEEEKKTSDRSEEEDALPNDGPSEEDHGSPPGDPDDSKPIRSH